MYPSGYPLNRYCRLSTRNEDELSQFLAAKDLGVRFSSGSKRNPPLDAMINAYYMPNTYISYLRYQAPVTLLASGDRPDFSLSLPEKGSLNARIGKEKIQGGTPREPSVLRLWTKAHC